LSIHISEAVEIEACSQEDIEGMFEAFLTLVLNYHWIGIFGSKSSLAIQ
jgi:hypothetical protein